MRIKYMSDEEMAKAAMSEEETVMTCSIESLDQISSRDGKGVFVVFTQEGCGYCEPFLAETDKALLNKVIIAESSFDDKQCLDLAKKYNVPGTPVGVYFKDGKEVRRVDPLGKTWDVIRGELNEIAKLAEASAPQPAPDSAPTG